MTHQRLNPLRILTLVALLVAFSSQLHAQYDNGSILGTIRDSSGAAIANASIDITNTATEITTEAKTNAAGEYDVPSLRVGVYTISASAVGFNDAVAQNITVSIGNRQHIDLTLTVGTAATAVEVTDVALQIETATSERGQNITNYQSEAFPLVTRNYSDLLSLVPGTRQPPSAATTSSINSLVRAGAYNVNGQRSMFNNFLLDGIDNNAYGESNQGFDNQIIAVPPDSVAQFQIVTNNESAEYGRSSGATINVASQSGTNHIHATVYEFIRNTDLNATGFFKPSTVGGTGITTPFKKPDFKRNQFGFNVSGPAIKNKFFYFLDYEGFRQKLTPLSVLTLPTQNELAGKLVVDVQNPVTGTPYSAGTAIPINSLSQQIVNLFKNITSLPASGVASTGLASSDYAVEVPFSDHSDKGDFRLDFQQSPSSSWFLRISDRKENAVNYPAIPLPLDGSTNGSIRVLNQQAALGYTHVFGPDKILDARVGLSRTKAGKYTLSIGHNEITIPGLTSNPIVAGGLPTMTVTNFSTFGRQSTNPQWQNPAVLDPKVNFTYIKGHHSLKFGYEYEHIWMAVNDNNPLFGAFYFQAASSACPYKIINNVKIPTMTGCNSVAASVADNNWADFLFGNSSSYAFANYYVAHLRQTMDNVYAQDDWKIAPNLTLNLGLRWEYASPYSDGNNAVSNFDPTTQTVLTTTPGASGVGLTPYTGHSGVYGHTLLNPALGDFGPRIGFAYAPDPNTAIRGGFGMSYAHYTRAGSADVLPINVPQAQFGTVFQSAPNASPHCATPLPKQIIAPGATTPSCYATLDQGFSSDLTTTFNPATAAVTYIPKDTKDSYVESYFLSVQRALAKNTLLDIAYIGNRGIKLQGFLNANQRDPSNGLARPFTNWPSDITEALNEFDSNYNALQVKYEQRFVRGLTLLNSFTWSHALDNASAALEGNTPAPQDGTNLRADYGQSDYNLPVVNITSFVYELPVGRGRQFLPNASPLVDSVLGGWQISTINTMQAGTPFNLTYSPATANQVSTQINANYRGLNAYRPNVVSGVAKIKNTQLANGYIQYVNPAAFSLPATSGNPFGNASRNPLRGTAFYQTDLSLNKKFSTPVESLKMEFRTEFYNVFNHTNLYLPSTIGGTFGSVASTGGQISSTFEPRIIQFGLKILY